MKWTYEICKAEALKYKTKKELKENNKFVYDKIYKEKWHVLFEHTIIKCLTYDQCKQEALKYNIKNQLKRNNHYVYYFINKNKWYELYDHMETKNTWTYEICKKEILKYKNKKDLKINNSPLYSIIYYNKWYELFEHMELLGSKYKRLIYVYEFSDNYCYIGLTFDINKRNNEHSIERKSCVCKHKKETGLEPILILKTDYINVEDAVIMEEKIKNDYEKNGWNILNKAKTGSIGGSILKWDYETCKKEALKYTNITDFIKNSSSAYNVINKNGWDEMCSHIDRSKSRRYWNNKEKCYNESLKYKTISEFRKNNWAAHKYSKMNNWLNDFYDIKKVAN